MKKLLALLLSMSMLIMCAPGISLVASAAEITMADFEGQDGTSGNPYIIDSPDKFLAIFSATGTLNATLGGGGNDEEPIYFQQTVDLTLDTYTPSATAFYGTYDGGGNRIKITTYVSTESAKQGLISDMNGTIKNLTLDANIDVTSKSSLTHIGGFAGYVNGGTIENCTMYGLVKAQKWIGGIAGTLQSGTIKNCINHAEVHATAHSVGGIVGQTYGSSEHTITNCANYGAVSANSTSGSSKFKNAGGIVGSVANNTTISYCFNAGAVSNGSGKALTHAGAIVGSVASTEGKPVSINNCFNTGNISAVTAAGIIATNSGDYTTITNVYDISSSQKIGAVVADGTAVTTPDNVLILGVGETTPDTILTAYDGNEAYECTADDGYDYPNFAITEDITVVYDPTIGGVFEITTDEPDEPGSSEDNPYLIEDEDDFEAVFGANGVENAKLQEELYFKQTADIVLYDYTPSATAFNGVYDGDGKKITIASYVSTGANYQGLMKELTGTIKNLTVAGEIDSTDSAGTVYEYVGSFAGISSGNIINCVNEANIKGKSHVGGFVGRAAGGTIKNCVNKGFVTGTTHYIGGIAGSSSTDDVALTLITNCGNYGTIKCINSNQSRPNNGGLVGYITAGNLTIEKSFNAGEIKGIKSGQTGGALIGSNAAGSDLNIKITDCFNVGKIKYTGASVIMSKYNAASGTKTHDATITNFYDIANPDLDAYPEDLPVSSKSNINVLSDTVTEVDIISAYTNIAGYECVADDGYDYPNFDTTIAGITVAYNPDLQIDISVVESVPQIFLSADADAGTEVYITDTTTPITTAYAIVNGQFTGINLSEYAGVEYGVLISKIKSGDNLTAETATEIANGVKKVTNNGVTSYGILIYGEKMVAGDTYYVRPFVKYVGEYYYGTGTSFEFPGLAE